MGFASLNVVHAGAEVAGVTLFIQTGDNSVIIVESVFGNFAFLYRFTQCAAGIVQMFAIAEFTAAEKIPELHEAPADTVGR